MARETRNFHVTEGVVPHLQTPAEAEQFTLPPEVSMVLLTWISFFLLLAILRKFAWRPILDQIESRENKIETSLKEAQHIKAEIEKLNTTIAEKLAKAETQAQQYLEDGRKAAHESAKHIEQRAREEVQIMVTNAQRAIQRETDQARASLREESAQIVVDLAGKLIEENLDQEKNQRLVQRFMQETT